MDLQHSSATLTDRFMLKWDHWHIEVSSKCALKCPRCPRVEIPESLLNTQLTQKFFEDQIGPDVLRQIKKITFCGNDGDPIYCSEFLDIVRYIKQCHPAINLVLITNGSHKHPGWWSELGALFDKNDEIQWSIDGVDQATNSQYRVNSDWDSIIGGIRAFKDSNTASFSTWALIGFKFNEHLISDAIRLAKSFQFDRVQITKSTKFGSVYPSSYPANDPLEPSKALMPQGHRYEREYVSISTRAAPSDQVKIEFASRARLLANDGRYSGICLIGNKGVFLNSHGEFYPCCWVANRFTHNAKWLERAKQSFNLTHRTFVEIINDPFWTNEFLQFDSYECATKCPASKLNDTTHTVDW